MHRDKPPVLFTYLLAYLLAYLLNVPYAKFVKLNLAYVAYHTSFIQKAVLILHNSVTIYPEKMHTLFCINYSTYVKVYSVTIV